MTGDHDTITLKDAAQHFGFGLWTLRAEASRGRLTLYKIGKRLYTTPADIRAMVEACRVEQKAPVYTSIRDEARGSSETARISSARDALELRLSRRKERSPDTSPRNTSRGRHATR